MGQNLKAFFFKSVQNVILKGTIKIEGYTAKKIHEIAPKLDASGVYQFMITLCENPQKAKEYIKKGFPRK